MALTAYEPHEIAEAFTRLATFATSGKATLNSDSYPQALGDIAIAGEFLKAYKTLVDSCQLPCAIEFDVLYRELVVKRESP